MRSLGGRRWAITNARAARARRWARTLAAAAHLVLGLRPAKPALWAYQRSSGGSLGDYFRLSVDCWGVSTDGGASAAPRGASAAPDVSEIALADCRFLLFIVSFVPAPQPSCCGCAVDPKKKRPSLCRNCQCTKGADKILPWLALDNSESTDPDRPTTSTRADARAPPLSPLSTSPVA